MTKMSGRKIQSIPGGGSGNGGDAVFFKLQFSDGSDETYWCDMSLLPMLLGNLSEYGRMSRSVSVKHDGRHDDVGAPYIVTMVDRSAHTLDGKMVVIEYGTNQGFPIQLAMTPAQAQQTIEFLQREMLLAQKPEADRRN